MERGTTIGIDVGGANTKVASASGAARSFYLPLWGENSLEDVLRKIRTHFQPKRVGVVMTGELADTFTNKTEGVCAIASAVDSVFAKSCYLNVRGQFTSSISKKEALLYAASNWIASAWFLAKSTKDCIFADVGSTTCDIIPIKDGMPVAFTTDSERLRENQLIYMGVLRTNVATLMRSVRLKGETYRLASELFSITADVHRVLHNIGEQSYTCATPDARGRNLEACYRRIARLLLYDLDEFGRENAYEVARQAERAQINELAGALKYQARKFELQTVIGAGLGEFLIAKAASKAGLECRLLSRQYGQELSRVFPAFAVAKLAKCA